MKYVALIERVLDRANGKVSLEQLLRDIDALDKSVPTLEELNQALIIVQESGRFTDHDLASITKDAYDRAIAANGEWMAQQLEKLGVSREIQRTAMETYLSSEDVTRPRPKSEH